MGESKENQPAVEEMEQAEELMSEDEKEKTRKREYIMLLEIGTQRIEDTFGKTRDELLQGVKNLDIHPADLSQEERFKRMNDIIASTNQGLARETFDKLIDMGCYQDIEPMLGMTCFMYGVIEKMVEDDPVYSVGSKQSMESVIGTITEKFEEIYGNDFDKNEHFDNGIIKTIRRHVINAWGYSGPDAIPGSERYKKNDPRYGEIRRNWLENDFFSLLQILPLVAEMREYRQNRKAVEGTERQ